MALKKENPVEWIYRVILIAIATATLVKVDKVDVHEERIEKIEEYNKLQDNKIDKINDALFVPAYSKNERKEALNKEKLETKFLIEYTTEQIASLNALGIKADSLLSQTQNN